MISSILKKIKNLIKSLRQVLSSVNWYETKSHKLRINKSKSKKLVIIKSRREIPEYLKDQYFAKRKNKLKRLNKDFYFLALVKKNTILSSGWIYLGKKWNISEINKNIKLVNTLLLFDFETPKIFRDKGFYKDLLRLIKYNFSKKRLAIYSLSNNLRSVKGIEGAGFKLVKKLNGLSN